MSTTDEFADRTSQKRSALPTRQASQSQKPLSIAMIGTRGVPARYGGFETAVEEVGLRLAQRGHHVRVYSRPLDAGTGPAGAADDTISAASTNGSAASTTDATPSTPAKHPREYLGMQVVNLPAMRRRSLETLSHTGLSVGHLVGHRTDVAFVFNAANAVWLPLVRGARIPVATHVDGLEWQRAKWGTWGQRYYRVAERESVRFSDALIADAQGIADYYRTEFNAPTELIAYGAPILDAPNLARLSELNLKPGEYHLVVARFEPENHVAEIVAGYARSGAQHPLIVVGSAPYADAYTAAVHARADHRVQFLGGVWDQDLLDALYAGALTYLHGHSVGGTNPSLLRAIGAGAPTIAYDVSFNREVLGADGRYFAAPGDIPALVADAESDPGAASARGAALQVRAKAYTWDDVATRYENLAHRLVARQTPGPRWRVRRNGASARRRAIRTVGAKELRDGQ